MLDSRVLARRVFILGALLDGVIAVSWFLIAYGVSLPNILNGYVSVNDDYRLAMFIAALFMSAWTVLLVWGAFSPVERKGLLLITASFLILSVILEALFYMPILAGVGFYIGCVKRLGISLLMCWSYYRLGEN